MTTLDKMLQGLANALGASLSTLTTTAKTVVGAINELKSGLTSTNTTVSGHTSTIGSGSLNTTAQTIIPAINELKGLLPKRVSTETVTVSLNHGQDDSNIFSVTGPAIVLFYGITITGSILPYIYTPSGHGLYIQYASQNNLYSDKLSAHASNFNPIASFSTSTAMEDRTTLVLCLDTVTFGARNASSNDGSLTLEYAVIEF